MTYLNRAEGVSGLRLSRRGFAGLSLGAVAALTGCGSIYPSKEATQLPAGGIQASVSDVTVGFAQQQLQAPYFAAMQVESEKIAAKQGFKLLFQSANKDPVVQMNQMQAMIAQGANVMIVNATSVKGQKPMMTQISSQIPVIYIDTSVPGTGATSVQSNNLKIGEESGKITAKRFLDQGKKEIKMLILTGPATDEFVGPARRQGFLNGLDAGGLKYDIMSEQPGDYQQDKGQVAAETMLAAHPDANLILGLNDSMALGAYNVVKPNPRYKDIFVAASADGQRQALELIKDGGKDGRYISTGLNSPSLAAEEALKIGIAIATGKKKPSDYPKESFTLAVGIGWDNIKEYYDPNSIF